MIMSLFRRLFGVACRQAPSPPRGSALRVEPLEERALMSAAAFLPHAGNALATRGLPSQVAYFTDGGAVLDNVKTQTYNARGDVLHTSQSVDWDGDGSLDLVTLDNTYNLRGQLIRADYRED